MKQTALDWFIEQLINEEGIDYIPTSFVKQAKQMEIEQIRRAFCHGEVARDRIDSMEYYNETYGNENK
jgi:glycerol-3-phosphate responsive antiterminator